MRTETRNNGLRDVTVIVADEGKVLKRISDGTIFGDEVWLGFTHYLGGAKLPEPLLEVPEHYTEVDIPEEPEEAPEGDNPESTNELSEEKNNE